MDMQQPSFRHVGILRGGPYCGIELHGHPLPGSLIVDDGTKKLDVKPTGGCIFRLAKVTGRYDAGNEYIRMPEGPMDFCELLIAGKPGENMTLDSERVPYAECDVDDDGNRTVLVFVDYQWTHGRAK